MKPYVLILLFAQSSPEATMTGRITDSLTHQPIVGATIRFCCPRTEVTTADDGIYSLHLIPENQGRPTFDVSKPGYSFVFLMDRERPRLTPGETVKGDYELIPQATISGRVVDRDSGKPLKGFIVQTRRLHAGGSRMGNFPTDADGAFTVRQLDAGDYVLQVDAPPGQKISFGDAKPDSVDYGTNWFPGVPREDMATPLRVAPGEKRDVEIRIAKRELAHISGVIQVPEGHEKDPVVISLSPPDRPLSSVAEGEIPQAGPFRIGGLNEGSYALIAWTKGGSPKAYATHDFELTDRSIDELKLTLRNAVTLRADVTMAEDKGELPATMSFFPVERRLLFLTEATGKMYAEALPPGEYWPALMVPAGYAVVAIAYNGQAAMNRPIDVSAPDSTVHFVLTSKPAGLSGFVRDADQNPVADATVVLLPAPLPAELSPLNQGRDNVQTDANGAFRLNGLAPGRYWAVVVRRDRRDHQRDIAYLRELVTSDSAVTLEAGQTASIDLRLK